MPETTSESAGSDDLGMEFVRLLNQHERRLAAYVMSLVPNWADVDEIVQETRIRLWRQFREYDPAKDFGAWACTIAHYFVLTHRSGQVRERARFSDAYAASMAEQFATLSEEPGLLQGALSDCLERVTDRNRELLFTYYAENSKVEEIARREGRTASSVYKAIAAAREFLFRCIDRTLRQEQA